MAVVTGFYSAEEGGARGLIDITQCPIAEPSVNEALKRFRSHPRPREGHCTLRADSGKPGAFRQTNDGAANELLALVESLMPTESAASHLIDAYGGAGFFARRLRDRFARTTILEWDRRAVEEARKDAAPHERYLCGDVAVLLPDALVAASADSTTLIVDPPSEGLPPVVRRTMLDTPPRNVVYVSCNPATLARDLTALREGYEIVSVTPLDMFPQTAQIEVVVALSRRH